MKKSLVLLELIFSIILLSIIFSITSKFLFEIYDKNKTNFTTNLTKIEFESTRLFLLSLLKKDHTLNNISYKEDEKIIYFNNNILQNKVTSFIIIPNNNIYTIKICIDLYNNICQTWIIK